ncbi:DNA recombination protein RmuC [Herbiconiux ginsengi]|uniref:DNA recombination protein RmuC n=1 Tax=Herbiconiux ginsengi TaxID=381665 RepID=A0A1H3SDV6_9MICO|nr:DNA recombination protein RmuC [Herbiconiux ginsengi]SDZ35917.1 DNA recombination protein RmuC [Herbiconiux ginsengi]
MDALAPLVIGLLVGIALGAATVWLVLRARSAVPAVDAEIQARLEAQVLQADERMRELAEERASLQSRLAASDATTTALREQGVLAREQFDAQLVFFREQAQERLAQQETQYKDQIATQEHRLADFQERLRAIQAAEAARVEEDGKVLVALSPVQESLKAVQAKVVELETQRQQQYGELSQQLKSATESEERLRSTAESLASALRSNSTRGVWGETQLRSVVEAAGLIERVDFDVQTSILSDSGAGRPDMVVHLPGGKNIAVDAKVPFDAYLEASAISSSATGLEGEHRTQLMKKHVKALRDHISALGTKGYWNGLEASPDLVIAFIPSESLVSSALEADPSIMEFAFGKKVALASPVTLWSVLKTVAFSWQQEVLTEDARKLFDLSKELYTRLGKTAQHIEKLGNTIERSVKDYNAFIGSLERQVYPTARKLAALNSENLFPERPAIEEAPREITGRELLAELESPTPAIVLSSDAAVADAPDMSAQPAADREADQGGTDARTAAPASAHDAEAADGTAGTPGDTAEAPDGEAEESDEERVAEVERTVAELDALGSGAALRDALFLEGEHDRVIEVEFDLDDKSGTTDR